MRRVILAISATAVALVLLLSFKTHTQSGPASPAALGTPAPGSGGAPSGAPSGSAASSRTAPRRTGPASTAAPAAGADAAGAARTVTGESVQTIYGPVQVRITVRGGKITGVTAPVYPEDTPRDYEINAYAIPQLNQETLQAGSAKIDMVSGATYTSQGYIGSLQSAVDKAGL